MKQARVADLAAQSSLFVMGAAQLERSDLGQSVLLLGTTAGFWSSFSATPEYRDGDPDPLDRWSKRVVGAIAKDVGAHAAFPSDGPPYLPFIRWALETGRFFQSPTGMMVHDTAGLMVSIRGAVLSDMVLDLKPIATPHPCETCPDRPCVTACPVGALSASAAYDVPACKGHLRSPPGQDCMTGGCLTRRACPVSVQFGRHAAQSGFHMAAFMGQS